MIIQPFAFMAQPSGGGGGIITQDLGHHWTSLDDSSFSPAVDWNDIGSIGKNLDVPTGVNKWNKTVVGGVNCWYVDPSGGSSSIRMYSPTSGGGIVTSLTIEAWVYPESNYAPSDTNAFCFILNTSGFYLVQRKTDEASLPGYPAAYNANAISNQGYNYTSQALTQNAWNHVATTFDGGSDFNKMYINGVEYLSIAQPWTQRDLNTSDIRIGGEEAGNTVRSWSGGFSVIRMYLTALSATDVLQNFDAEKSIFGL